MYPFSNTVFLDSIASKESGTYRQPAISSFRSITFFIFAKCLEGDRIIMIGLGYLSAREEIRYHSSLHCCNVLRFFPSRQRLSLCNELILKKKSNLFHVECSLITASYFFIKQLAEIINRKAVLLWKLSN